MTMIGRLCIALLLLVVGGPALAAEACGGPVSICPDGAYGAAALIRGGTPVAIVADAGGDPGIARAIGDLAMDFSRVAGTAPPVLAAMPEAAETVVIVGRIDSPLVRRLAAAGKLDLSGLADGWEAYVHQLVEHPAPGVDRALVIAGADKRGTIFGIYDLSQGIGVSPWHWWADVPARHRDDLFVTAGRRFEKPAVKYRGIFLNDEEPALGDWARQTFGGFNHQFYAKVYELILRMRGNYLWPAMWGKAIYDDDPQSAALADQYGVVIGTSHHEPMMRAHVEWERYGKGPWDYTKNAERLRAFWREGIERMGDNESLVTVGMRGDGDEPMTEGTAIGLLERIVRDQRGIIEEVTGRPAAETPQVWALYKEVQDYYDKGMRVPDDVTLLFSDDNWGNIRRLPEPGVERPGGYGVYYHFDYVGGPRNYKWIDTTQIERVWEQMHLAHEFGADRLWIVNVGDLKPMEYPISFFLDYAWDPEAWPLERLPDYPRLWAERQFGPDHAEEIGAILTRYAELASRRKPELLGPDTYSLTHFHEADRVLREWAELRIAARLIGEALPPDTADAYFQLVLHPILANGNLHKLYATVARNRLYAEQGRATANDLADEARALYALHGELRRIYEEEVAGGKWAHMMSQAVIGYTGWQQPDAETMPEVRTIDLPAGPHMGVAVEGSRMAWPEAASLALPELDPFGGQSRTIEVFSRGTAPFTFRPAAGEDWIRLSQRGNDGIRGALVEVAVDWAKAPKGRSTGRVTIAGSEGSRVEVAVPIFNPENRESIHGFVESGNHVAIDAADYGRAVGGSGIEWKTIPHLGRYGAAVTAFPVIAPALDPGGDSPRLEYPVHLFSQGEVEATIFLSPTLDFKGERGLRYAISIDDGAPQIVNVHADASERAWGDAVARNGWESRVTLRVDHPGHHVVKLWLVDPGLVFQRLLLTTGPVGETYLGPPESARR